MKLKVNLAWHDSNSFCTVLDTEVQRSSIEYIMYIVCLNVVMYHHTIGRVDCSNNPNQIL